MRRKIFWRWTIGIVLAIVEKPARIYQAVRQAGETPEEAAERMQDPVPHVQSCYDSLLDALRSARARR